MKLICLTFALVLFVIAAGRRPMNRGGFVSSRPGSRPSSPRSIPSEAIRSMASATIGPLRERLLIQENVPDPISVTSLTRSSTTATAVTATPHTYATGDYVTVGGATPTGYNGKVKITVTGASSFTYPVNGTLATPATGTITVTYFSNAQGQRVVGWQDFATIWGEQLAVRAYEKLQVQALQGQLDYRFRVFARGDLTKEMRAIWTPQWPPASPQHTLEIHGIVPDGDGRQYMFLECGEIV